MRKLLRCVPLLLCLMHLLPAAGIVCLEKCGCHIRQTQNGGYHWFLAAATLLAAVFSAVRKPEWNRPNNAAALLLPLCCITDIAFAAGHQTQVYLPILACMLASMPIFFSGRAKWLCRLPLCMLTLLALFFFAFGGFLEGIGFAPQVTVLSEVSPEGDRIAVVECIDEGALGGRTRGYVYRCHPDSVPDRYIRYGKQVMDLSFIEPEDVVLYWEDNDTAVFNNGVCDAGNLLG